MRLCVILRQQHAGEMFVKHWKVQGKRILKDTGALRELNKRGIQVVDAAEYIFPSKPKPPERTIETVLESYNPKPLEINESYVYSDKNVLLGGLDQAKVLTNTVEQPFGLPQSVNDKTLQLPDNINDLVTKCLKSSLIYDVEQKKLPKRKDPERPAWNFPRDYGITDRRKNKLLCLRLLELCSKLSRCLPVIENGIFTVNIERNGLPVTLSLRSDDLVLREKPVELELVSKSGLNPPDISPLQPTISIEVATSLSDQHPLTSETSYRNIQLAISHFNETEVTNLYESPVTTEQFYGRSLLKAFTFGAAQARYLYGGDVVDLPKPLTIPCLHTDSQRFHFYIYQLNTLRETGAPRNHIWSLPIMQLFSECKYIDAIPTVKDFNPDVFKMLFTFYNL